jgi:pimeloyl-ACP methyl ester carboxylesterase
MHPGLWAAAAAAAAVAIVLVPFMRWRRAAYRRVESGSAVAETKLGPVEYARRGAGPVVMVLHGGLGGFDQGVFIGSDLGIPQAFSMLSPSRAGYLRTPLHTCATPPETADALAALLDALHIDDVSVVGISGGGPTALQFALRHGRRTRALVMVAAISSRHEQPERTRRGMGRLLFARGSMWLIDLACWVLFVGAARWRPALLAKWFFRGSETLDKPAIRRRVDQLMRDPAQIAWMRRLVSYLLPLSLRRTGLRNDLAQFASMPEYPVERIACPTLVVHGRFDGNVPLEHGEFVARGVPGARMHVVEGCGHLVWLSERAGEVRDVVMEFLREHAGPARRSGPPARP